MNEIVREMKKGFIVRKKKDKKGTSVKQEKVYVQTLKEIEVEIEREKVTGRVEVR